MESVPLPPSRESPTEVRSLTGIEEFIRSESAGAVLLLAATGCALVWANSPQSASYFALWKRQLELSLGDFSFSMDLAHWIDDGLMSLFFLVVGLEIKREILKGELSSHRRAALPAFAALGGMLVPAFIYFALNRHGEAARGWAIPMATDIGFAAGAIALLGKRIPSSLRVFLLALAIVDDIGAILVIAIFYTRHTSWWAIGIALTVVAALIALSSRVQKLAIYIILGIALWVALLKSGVHPTLAGVILGFLTPMEPRYEKSEMIPRARWLLERFRLALQNGQEESVGVTLLEFQALINNSESMAERLERSLHPWVSFFILPLFALSSAGIVLSAEQFRMALTSPSAIGIFLGLTVGKVAGVTGFSFFAVKLRLATMAEGADWKHFIGIGMLAGIGFTIALFVSGLAFTSEDLQSTARMAILTASLASGVLGCTYLLLVHRGASA